MGRAKEITLKVIPGKIAKPYIEKTPLQQKGGEQQLFAFWCVFRWKFAWSVVIRSEFGQIKNYNARKRDRLE